MGTALGDLTATTFHLGYLASGFLFAAVIAVPAIGFWLFGWNAIFSFWFACVATRPLGASFAGYMGKPKSLGGLGWGDWNVALVVTLVTFALAAFLGITRRDVQRGARLPADGIAAPVPVTERAPDGARQGGPRHARIDERR
jgi:uncharacterized membrane-anchored protein